MKYKALFLLAIIVSAISLSNFAQQNAKPAKLQLLQHEAEDNDPNAQVLYGLAYLDGREGVDIDIDKAVFWLKRSARQGNAYGQFKLGELYHQGIGVEQNAQRAVALWKQSALQENPQAEFNLGKALLSGVGINKNTDQAIHWLEKSAEHNNKQAQIELSKLFSQGYDVPKDETRAQSWLNRAAELGDSPSTGFYALLKKSINFTLKIFEESPNELMQRAKNGDAQAQYELGERYESGAWDVTKDETAALFWINKSASNGNIVAMKTLADIFRFGDLGTKIDLKKSEFWAQKAKQTH